MPDLTATLAGADAAPAPRPGPRLPLPRGPRSERLVAVLRRRPHDPGRLPDGDDALDGEDTPLAIHVLYELHYRGFDGVDERWEWEPGLLRERRRLEEEFEGRLVATVGPPPIAPTANEVTGELDGLLHRECPSLSRWILEHGGLRELRELAVHRSIYQLREADSHTFAIPRLFGGPKAALVEIQRGEYGDGAPAGVHAEVFGETMVALGLDATYGAYLDHTPGTTLSTVNLVDLFGLHRRWRGALAGHLAHFEMASAVPMGRYAAALRAAGRPSAARFYDLHVEADAHHGPVGRDLLAAGLARVEPAVAGDIVFGARALAAVEDRFATAIMERWACGDSSLRRPIRCDGGT
ncbi:MAG TPA: iron-containing redox enzyme family protein [Acidimicrobiales bacterium]|nr:iron-containing redox enzyme family protein [Acidimicrobiales bacterium]